MWQNYKIFALDVCDSKDESRCKSCAEGKIANTVVAAAKQHIFAGEREIYLPETTPKKKITKKYVRH